MKVKGIRHTGIVTSNINTMIKFYTEVFGFNVIWDKIERPVGFKEDIHTVKLQAEDGSILELCNKHIENWHIALTISNTNKELTNILENKISWIRDPDGNLLELVDESV